MKKTIERFGTDLIRNQKDDIKIFANKKLGIKVGTIKNSDGSISINAEDTAIGFGWYQIKNNKKYPKWERMNSFIRELEYSPLVGKGDFIPESLFYLLAMKANNDAARKFQTWLALEVIPQIRKTGHYSNKPTSSLDLLELQFKALKEVDSKVDTLDYKFEEFKEDIPLFNIECDELQALVREKGIEVLGGKGTMAYKDNSLRSKVYSDIQKEIKRQFQVRKYKAIKRKHFELAKKIIRTYSVPILLQDEIDCLNNQLAFKC